MSKYSSIKYRKIKWDYSVVTSRFKWAFIIVIAFILMSYLPNLFALLSSSRSMHQDEYYDHDEISPSEQLAESFDQFSKKLLSRLGLNESEANLTSVLPARLQLSNHETYEMAERESNLALLYWDKWKDISSDYHERKSNVQYCSEVKLTDPFEVQHNNLYWQQLEIAPKDGDEQQAMTMFLYNAYYDNRKQGSPVVKLLTANSKDHVSRQRTWWCLLWFDKIKEPLLVKVSDYYTLMGDFPGYYHPQLLTCPIPQQHTDDIPEAVSLQAQGHCDQVQAEPSNVLRVIYEPASITEQTESSIGVCVQAFRFATYDISVRLVEWLELVRIMGADKVNLYLYGASENTHKVLQHYEKQVNVKSCLGQANELLQGLVNLRAITLPGKQPNLESLYNLWAFKLGEKFWPMELVELNDCLYRNLYRHKYLAVIDIDEVIIPQKDDNWHKLIERIESKFSASSLLSKAYYSASHSHVCEVMLENERKHRPIPEYLYMMRHTYRAGVLKPWQNVKCFHRTDQVSAVHNHLPLRCVGGQACQGVNIEPDNAILWHYRRNQSHPSFTHRNTECPIHEHTAWKYYERLQRNVRNQLSTIFGHN